MAYWKAAAVVHDTREEDLRGNLTESLDSLDEIAAALECEPYEEEILDAIASLKTEVEQAVDAEAEERDEKLELKEKLREAEGEAKRFEELAFAPLEQRTTEFERKERERKAELATLEAKVRELKAEVENLERARATAAAAPTIPAPPPAAPSFRPLTANLRKALTAAAQADGISPWEFGSGTIGALKKRGYIAPHAASPSRYYITAAGREALR